MAKFIEEDYSPQRIGNKTVNVNDINSAGLRSSVIAKAGATGKGASGLRPAPHCSLLCFARVIELLSILGLEKAHMTSKILQGIQKHHSESFAKEVCSGIEESHKAVKQLLETCAKLQQQQSRIGAKSNSRVSNSAAGGNTGNHRGNNEEQLIFVAAFAADISHTLHSFVSASALGNTLSSYEGLFR